MSPSVRWLGAALFLGGCQSLPPLQRDLSLADAPARRDSIAAPAGGQLAVDLYGRGPHGVVIIAHGGYSTLASWRNLSQFLAMAGHHVLVVEARAAADLAAGKDTPCLYEEGCLAKDVLAAERGLRALGARRISLIGGSMGGGAVAQASTESASPYHAIVLLSPAAIAAPEQIKGPTLVIATKLDANSAGLRLPGIQAQYDRMPEPKRFTLFEGSAHGQRIFYVQEGIPAMLGILNFLSSPRGGSP